jgi:hypothetical protein
MEPPAAQNFDVSVTKHALGHLRTPHARVCLQRKMVPIVQYILLYRLNTLLGIESMRALPALLFSHETMMRLVSLKCAAGAARRVPAGCHQTVGAANHGDHPPRRASRSPREGNRA